jgi:HD-GYP domain-containing protein (c-di-GMP phosphodiesterase class II)
VSVLQRRATQLFPGLQPRLRLGTGPDPTGGSVFALRARGRTIGVLQTARPVPRHRRRQRATLSALADHAGRALDQLAAADPGPPVAPRTTTRSRLAVAARLATKLAPLDDPLLIAQTAVDELHSAFGFFLAVIQRLDVDDAVLRILAAAGPLSDSPDFLAHEQPLHEGVNGRVARTGRPAVIPDTTKDPDYLRRDPRSDPGSELSLPIHVDGAIWGVLNLEQLATHAFGDDDLLLADAVAAQVGAALHRARLTTELESSFASTLGILADVLETKDAYTADHADEVAGLALTAGRRLGLTDAELRPLRYCALLHDIGKIGVRSEILTKPGRLSPDEFAEIKEHSAIGDALLRRIPLLADVAPLVRAVHERYDGAGYPDGLQGKDIPLPARIVAVCDALHAMTSDRPYRRARPLGHALAELRRCAGTQFDPAVVDAVVAAQAATGALAGASPEPEPEDPAAPAAASASAANRARRSSRISSSAGTSASRIPTSDHV